MLKISRKIISVLLIAMITLSVFTLAPLSSSAVDAVSSDNLFTNNKINQRSKTEIDNYINNHPIYATVPYLIKNLPIQTGAIVRVS